MLSAKTLRVTLKSFELYNRDPLIARMKAHREDLESHPNWIFSNLRPHDLPSGRRRIRYATTRSARIPGLMVDVTGAPPDIYLPVELGDAAKQEVRRL